MTQPGYPHPDPLPPPPPPTPAAVIAAHQRRYDAAVELIRAGGDLRELAKLRVPTAAEQVGIDADPRVREAVAAMRAVRTGGAS